MIGMSMRFRDVVVEDFPVNAHTIPAINSKPDDQRHTLL
ncbi:hypothetical protein SynA1560_02405 [Synechococcus sp. A15-60]|nr:hypothetical protein SynA1560_02405 [Synechococcus sp. A15-60]